MKMIDAEKGCSVRTLKLYFTPKEATVFRDKLAQLLVNPEADEHFHALAEDMSRDISCSILTETKLKTGKYTELEKKILSEK
jgi:hypothetical protein